MNEHEHGENDEVQAGQGFGQALVVACQPPEAVEPAEAALDYPTAGPQHEALLRLGQLDDLQLNPFLTGSLRSRVSLIALGGECKFHRLASDMLDLLGKLLHLCPFLFIGRRDVHRQQIPQRVDSHMNLAAPLALVTVVTRTRTAFARGLQSASTQDTRPGPPLWVLCTPDDR